MRKFQKNNDNSVLGGIQHTRALNPCDVPFPVAVSVSVSQSSSLLVALDQTGQTTMTKGLNYQPDVL